jgi:ubiquinone/menaquinone biosynthesis C-methylase UbiE
MSRPRPGGMLARMTTTIDQPETTYVFDQAWQRERQRLTSIEASFDAASQRFIRALGLEPGWRCLELGFGAGSMARWLAHQVGPTGSVLATDLDPRFLQGHGIANLEVRQHNVVVDPLEPASFDLIHARAVMMYVNPLDAALAKLVAALKPGGWIIFEDVHFGGAAAAAIACYVEPATEQAITERAMRAVAEVFSTIGADPNFGPKLPALLKRAGLTQVAAEVHAPVVDGGAPAWVPMSLEAVRPRIAQLGLLTDAEAEQAIRALGDPAGHYLTPLLVSAWGQRA